MPRSSVALVFALLLAVSGAVSGSRFRVERAGQEPDTSCGKGFENLVPGSRDYYTSAAVKLWTHPYHTMDNATFETELQCWFAAMCTSKCGSLPSQADTRKNKLTAACQSVTSDWYKVWNMFSKAE